jgi:hypothetical protein
MTVDTLVSIASAVAAIAALALSYGSNAIARRALRISQQQHAWGTPNLSVYLADSFRRPGRSGELVAFSVTFINHSDRPDSIVRIELEVHYSTLTGLQNHLIFPLGERGDGNVVLNTLSSVHTPLRLSARGTASGWLVFQVHREAFKGTVQRYRVIATTATGNRVSFESYLLREVRDEEEVEEAGQS